MVRLRSSVVSTLASGARGSIPGRVAQSVTCLATDACLTADPGVVSSIRARSHTFVEIDHEIISTVILLPSADSLIHSRRVVASYKRKYVHKLLVNRLFKPAQENVCLGELTVLTRDVKQQKQSNKSRFDPRSQRGKFRCSSAICRDDPR